MINKTVFTFDCNDYNGKEGYAIVNDYTNITTIDPFNHTNTILNAIITEFSNNAYIKEVGRYLVKYTDLDSYFVKVKWDVKDSFTEFEARVYDDNFDLVAIAQKEKNSIKWVAFTNPEEPLRKDENLFIAIGQALYLVL